MLRELCENKDATTCIYTDTDGVTQTLTFQTRRLHRLFAAFPEVMMVDSTYAINNRRFNLFSFPVLDLDRKARWLLKLFDLLHCEPSSIFAILYENRASTHSTRR